ncbi:MAG: Crp family transcriptional regulator [Bacillales bacterium]|nr:Crp family transcriptional regulator [Bacillales bacterium]
MPIEFNSNITIPNMSVLLKMDHRKVQYKKGDLLFREGEPGHQSFLVLSGRVRISKIHSDGSEFTLRICQEDELCGELILFNPESRYFYNAEAITDCEIAILEKTTMENEIVANPTVGLEFLIWMNNHIRKTMTRFWGLTSCGKKGTLYATLIRLANSFGIKNEDGSILIDLHVTNQDLASFCASTRETVNIFLNELKKEGIVTIEKGKITIRHIEHLRKIMGCDNCVAVYCTIH